MFLLPESYHANWSNVELSWALRWPKLTQNGPNIPIRLSTRRPDWVHLALRSLSFACRATGESVSEESFCNAFSDSV